MPPRPLIVILALAACTGDDTAPADGTTEADSTAGDVLDTGTMSGGMTMGDDDDDDDDDDDGDDDDSTTTMGDDDDDSSSDETGPVACVDDGDCEGMGNQVFCEGDVCVDCNATPDGDAACADANPDTPACSADGQCVTCLDDTYCNTETPICDTDSSTCRECLQHAECPSGACKIPLDIGTNVDGWGECFDAEPTPADDSNITGIIQGHGSGDLIVHLSDAAVINESVAYASNGFIAILPAPGEQPQWQQTETTGPSLSVSNQGNVYIYGMRFSTNSDDMSAALRADGGKLHIQRSRIVNNDGGGVFLTNDGRAVIENSFVGGIAGEPAVLIDNGSDANIVYSTLVSGAFTDVLACPMGMMAQAGDVTVRNSLIAVQVDGNEISCSATSLDVTYTATAVPPMMPFPGMGNVGVGEFPGATPEDWFVNVTNNFSLQNDATGLMEDVALWVDGDPPTDIDGTPRPAKEGPDYAGAHIP